MTDAVLRLTPEAFEWRSWHGEAVIYDALGGDTHRLAHPSGHVLCALHDAPGGEAASSGLARCVGEPGDEALGAALDALVEVGIVDEVPREGG